MNNQEVIFCGHRRQIKYFEQLASRGFPVTTFLFHGPEMVGKKMFAIRLLAGLFCGSGQMLGCGTCKNCIDIIAARHPDMHFLHATENREIGVAGVRDLRQSLSLSPFAGSWRGVIIDGAHYLTHEAQSALLKILEEPPAKTLFFLVTPEPHTVLDTVRSRLLPMSFGSVPDEEFKDWLLFRFKHQHVPEDIMREAAGRPGFVECFMANPKLSKTVLVTIAEVRNFLKKEIWEQFHFIDSLLAKEDVMADPFLRALISEVRKETLLEPEVIKNFIKLKLLLELYDILRGSPVNRRLVLDSALLALRNTNPYEYTNS